MAVAVDALPPPPAQWPPPTAASQPQRWFQVGAVGFHVVVVGVLGAIVVLSSQPGRGGFYMVFGAAALAMCGATWVVAGVIQLAARRSGRRIAATRWFLLAPLLVLSVLGLRLADVPFNARWRASREAFTDVVDQAQPGLARNAERDMDHGDRLGLYSVSWVYQRGDAVIFYTGSSGVEDDAGFAYLPSGPFPELATGDFESPRFESIGDGWYTWTASW